MTEANKGREGMPWITYDMPDNDDQVNMAKVRALLYCSDRRAEETSPGVWTFTFNGCQFGPLYQIHGTAEVFTPADELTNFTTGARLADSDEVRKSAGEGVDARNGVLLVAEDVVARWIERTTT